MLFMNAIFDFWDLQGPKMAQNGPKLLRKPQVVILGHLRLSQSPCITVLNTASYDVWWMLQIK